MFSGLPSEFAFLCAFAPLRLCVKDQVALKKISRKVAKTQRRKVKQRGERYL
jgi:hypothetical protein